jgi:VCBS repeat-containing protein
MSISMTPIPLTQALNTRVWSGGSLSNDQTKAITDAFTLTTKTAIQGTGQGTQAWQFSTADSNLDFLSAGETITATYTVTVADGKGGTAAQDVLVTMNGRNDVPVITSAASNPTYTEAATSRSLTATNLSGTLTFTDVDINDRHSVTQTLQSLTWTGGSLTTAQKPPWPMPSVWAR